MPTDSHPHEPSMAASDSYRTPHTADELTQENVEAILRLEHAAKAPRTASDRVAAAIAAFCGSMVFVWVHVVWFVLWIVANVVLGTRAFDPFPYTFLTLCVSLEAIFLSAFILISQNQEALGSERRNQLDLQINLLAEQENTKILAMLSRIAERLDVRVDDDPSTQVLEEATRPEKLVEQIEHVAERQANEPK